MPDTLLDCTRCGARPAAVLRELSGERACKRCFAAEIEGTVRRAVNKHKMLAPSDRVAFALSGGKDSVALIHVLLKTHPDLFVLHRREGRAPLAITIDEGIARYREESLAIARATCQELGIDHLVFSFKEWFGKTLDEMISAVVDGGALASIHQKHAPGQLKNAYKIVGKPCSICGVLRRRLLNDIAARSGATVLTTGHNMNDEVETFLINLTRGDATRMSRVASASMGAAGPFVRKVKPLQDVHQGDIVQYVYHAGGTFQSERCPYAKSEDVFRGEVQAIVNRLEKHHPGAVRNIKRFMDATYPLLAPGSAAPAGSPCPSCGAPKSEAMDSCMACFYIETLCGRSYPGILERFMEAMRVQ